MAQIIHQEDIFGRVGRNIGEGLSEQLPKEVEARRLSSQFKKMGLPEEFAVGATVPGFFKHFDKIAPYIRSGREKEAAKDRIGAISSSGAINGAISDQENIPMRERSDYLVPQSPEQLSAKAIEESNRSKIPYEQVLAGYQARDAQRLATEQAHQARIDKAVSDFDKQTEKLTQKEGKDFTDIIGEMKQRYENDLASSIDRGGNQIQDPINKAKELLDFAKTKNQLRNLSKEAGLVPLSDPKDQLKSIRKTYQDKGALEELRNDLVTYFGLSPQGASRIAFPTSKEVEKKIPPRLGQTSLRPGEKRSKVNPEKVYSDILDDFPKDQSLQSVAKSLDKRGYSGLDFLKMANDLNEKNQASLTELQKRELPQAYSASPALGDLFYFSIFGGE